MKQHWFAFAFAFESVSPIHTIYYVLNVSSSYKCTVHHLSSAGKKFCARKQKQRRKKNGNTTTAKWICKFRLRLTMSVQRSLVWEIIAVARCRLKLRRLCEVKKKKRTKRLLSLKNLFNSMRARSVEWMVRHSIGFDGYAAVCCSCCCYNAVHPSSPSTLFRFLVSSISCECGLSVYAVI